MLIKTVVQVYPTEDFVVYVYFCDGKIKLFNMKHLLNKGVFCQISNVDDFINKCTVLNGTLAWDLSGNYDPTNCIDIDPETIYQNGIDMPCPPSL